VYDRPKDGRVLVLIEFGIPDHPRSSFDEALQIYFEQHKGGQNCTIVDSQEVYKGGSGWEYFYKCE
jgi:hypothetical protein